ncbi:MAG: helix-turn-helix transcriptional regulator, partial [Clostridia bacterium]|nr:helix-turn-helix transcriptional regulator [Clostridia bacterium]
SEVQNEYFFTSKDTDEMKISDLISDIMLEWNTMNYCFEMELRSKLLEFFTRILRHLYSNGFISEVGTIRPEVKKAIVYVTDNYSTVSEKELARICHLSYNYFSYLFKKTIGKSFKDYLLDIKIFQAEKMLLSTEKSITDIAQETGFSTTSHFISQFKKKNGITPAKFKKEFTGNEQARS